MSYFDKHGLLSSRDNFPGEFNSSLYTVEYYLRIRNREIYPSKECMIPQFDSILTKLYLGAGIFKSTPDDPLTESTIISHDNVIAIASMSYLSRHTYHINMWHELLRQGFRYNNVTPKSPGLRFMPPETIIYLGMLAGNPIAWLFYPYLIVSALISGTTSTTSGKLLFYVMGLACNMKILIKGLSWVINRNNNFITWNKVFSTYFTEPKHPLNRISL